MENKLQQELIPKPVKEHNDADLLELTLQLHTRANIYPSKEMHDAYIEARKELEKRLEQGEGWKVIAESNRDAYTELCKGVWATNTQSVSQDESVDELAKDVFTKKQMFDFLEWAEERFIRYEKTGYWFSYDDYPYREGGKDVIAMTTEQLFNNYPKAGYKAQPTPDWKQRLAEAFKTDSYEDFDTRERSIAEWMAENY